MNGRPERDTDLDALLGAYALDALPPDEQQRVEAYLAGNAAARAEVDDLRETAAALALAPVDDLRAPPELWERIQGELGDELAVRRRSRARRVSVWVTAAAAALAFVVGVATVVALDDGSRTTDVATAYERAVEAGAREFELTGGDGAVASIALLDDGTGYLLDEALDPLDTDRVYQLWAVVGPDQRVISAGVLGSDPDAAAFTVAGPVEAFVITVEQAPGVPVSEQEPFAASV